GATCAATSRPFRRRCAPLRHPRRRCSPMSTSPEPTDRPLSLALVGPMAAGKTSVGRKVARLLHVPFTDTDRRVVAEHGPIPRIFAEEGEARFREYERAAVAAALAEGGV